MEQLVETLRAKKLDRVLTKAGRRAVLDPETLLTECYEPQPGASLTFPVGDLLGLRVLVRSLLDVAIIKEAVLARRNIGDAGHLTVDDINEHPRSTGYRALHIDGTVTFEKSGDEFTLPFEVQVKTLAQHVFGQHTHEDAYVRDEINSDPRFDVVRNLQRAMAESLNAVDLTQAEIEVLAERVRDEIAQSEPGEEIDFASVLSVVHITHQETLKVVEAQAISRRAHRVGLRTADELREVIDRDGDRGKRATRELESMLRAKPNARQHIQEVLRRMELEGEAEREAAAEANETANTAATAPAPAGEDAGGDEHSGAGER